ncbi:patatin-like phospholipase family protein [Sulfurimonas microaerophilic]|uniref:patatin-like phospholipase family protein n=1 Tax=Sulfurimonas microaerophilic TaxID=3058392 RepID=UPI002715556E|nr:patatin-like phospholipase family protein [Sulfurimonas sp. hsl 1-7]
MEKKRIGIALSGGGFRASVFHIGVLKALAENNQLENVEIISTVSGGSLTVALIYKLNNNKWPTSHEYLTSILPSLQKYFVELNLGANIIQRLFYPKNWINIFSRANIVADSLKNYWQINASLNNLEKKPIWEINATTNETGKNWRFSQEKMGDYKFGVIKDPTYFLSDAVAASAAYPGIIGRFTLKTNKFTGWEVFDWKDKSYKEKKTPLEFSKLHLSDGGLYNNLGEEPLIDELGKSLDKNIDFFVISDASKPLLNEKSKASFRILARTLRLIDIAMDQIKALRTRAIHSFLNKHPKDGIFVRIGQYQKELNEIYDSKAIGKIKTNFFSLSDEEYELLVNYSNELTHKSLKKYIKN